MFKHAVAASLFLSLFACAAEPAASPEEAEAAPAPAAEPEPSAAPVVVDGAHADAGGPQACQGTTCRTAVLDPDPCTSAGGCDAVPPAPPPPPPPCAAGAITKKTSAGTFVTFHVGAAADGTAVAFPDGSFYAVSVVCKRVSWTSVKLACHKGTWSMDQGAIAGDAFCMPDQNANWSDGTNSISTGFSP